MITADFFRAVRDRDCALLGLPRDNFLVCWEWAKNAQCYEGPGDLIRWFEWIKPYHHYFRPEQIAALAWMSECRNREIFSNFGWPYSYPHVDEYSATDYLLQNLYPLPERMRVRRVLDFGAGFGRQANLWCQLNPDLVFVGMDGIENSYCLQHLYYSLMGRPLHDYMAVPASFAVKDEPGIYHLPTWRSDLLPENFFDMVLCVQVLQEINEQLVLYMLKTFQRCLKPGGALYIRDHEDVWQPAHTLRLGEMLPDFGFELEFRPYVIDSHPHLYAGHGTLPDIHGIPRIWRKRDPEYPVTNPRSGGGR
jgi:SAM-dependent methyltransferase